MPIGTQSSGQGHETVFPQVVAEILGVPEEAVSIVTGDTRNARGWRIAFRPVDAVGGIVMQEAAQKAIETAREQAAGILEAASRMFPSRREYSVLQEPIGPSIYSTLRTC